MNTQLNSLSSGPRIIPDPRFTTKLTGQGGRVTSGVTLSMMYSTQNTKQNKTPIISTVCAKTPYLCFSLFLETAIIDHYYLQTDDLVLTIISCYFRMLSQPLTRLLSLVFKE